MALCTTLAPARSTSLELTSAVRPANPNNSLHAGYRAEVFCDQSGLRIPALAAAAPCDQLLDLFFSLLQPLGKTVDLILETTHLTGGIQERRRRGIDRPVLESYLCEFEDLLLNDGCTGVAVVATNRPSEVQFDEHKQIIVYSHNRRPFRKILDHVGLRRDDKLELICESPHYHFTTGDAYDRFEELAGRLGAD